MPPPDTSGARLHEANTIESQHAKGKLTARERIDGLLDDGSFFEFGAGGDVGRAGVVTGRGTIGGRPVFVFAKDYTVRVGSLSRAHATQIASLHAMARRGGAPIIGLFDADGVRLEDGFAALAGLGAIYRAQIAASLVPQIAVIMGPCIGGDALSATLADFVVMVQAESALFVTGPEVIESLTNERIPPEALGGASIHAEKGIVADGIYVSDIEALLQVRRLVEFLPLSKYAPSPVWPAGSRDAGDDASLDLFIPDDPAEPHDINDLIEKLTDDGDVFPLQAAHSANVITAFGRLDGHPVGFVANQPLVLGGAIDADAAQKAARFVRLCDRFNLPVVTLVDCPGFCPGLAQEHGGIARHVGALLHAYAEATVPKVTVITRHAYGGAYLAMASKALGSHRAFAWPSARIGLKAPGSSAEGLMASEPGALDAVIASRETRRVICDALSVLREDAISELV